MHRIKNSLPLRSVPKPTARPQNRPKGFVLRHQTARHDGQEAGLKEASGCTDWHKGLLSSE